MLVAAADAALRSTVEVYGSNKIRSAVVAQIQVCVRGVSH